MDKLWRLIVLCGATLLAVPAVAVPCGVWDATATAAQFAKSRFGKLAIEGQSQYFTFKKNTCVELSGAPRPLTFTVNHNGAPFEQPTFLSVHVALVSFRTGRDQQYLYRNLGSWTRDRSGLPYSSTHSDRHGDFDSMLSSADASVFEERYQKGRRSWLDSVDTTAIPPYRQDAWSTRDTFRMRSEFQKGLADGSLSVQTQNYLISFRPRKTSNDLGEPPYFEVGVANYDCAFIRISGPAGYAELGGQYAVSFSDRKSCIDIIPDLMATRMSIRSFFGLTE